MAEKFVQLSQVSSEQTLNDRQSIPDFKATFENKIVDKNIFYKYVSGASTDNLPNQNQMS